MCIQRAAPQALQGLPLIKESQNAIRKTYHYDQY